MSMHLFFGVGENPGPGLALGCLNLIFALAIVGVSLLLGVAVSLLAWLHELATGDARSIRCGAERRAVR